MNILCSSFPEVEVKKKNLLYFCLIKRMYTTILLWQKLLERTWFHNHNSKIWTFRTYWLENISLITVYNIASSEDQTLTHWLPLQDIE